MFVKAIEVERDSGAVRPESLLSWIIETPGGGWGPVASPVFKTAWAAVRSPEGSTPFLLRQLYLQRTRNPWPTNSLETPLADRYGLGLLDVCSIPTSRCHRCDGALCHCFPGTRRDIRTRAFGSA